MRRAFDNEKYISEQIAFIRERMKRFDGRLYLEFGGKLLNDFHASRVLPGYDPNVKIRLLKELEGEADILLCIHAGAIEQRKIRADYGITYDADAMKLIDDLTEWGLSVSALVITRWEGQARAKAFKTKMENRGIRVFLHSATKGYPDRPDIIVSEDGYGKNPWIEVKKPLVVVTGPGPASGKMATSLSQIYHESRMGQHSMFAKFETFPIWNLPIDHPVNIAYEAATMDLNDSNQIDPFHLKAYGKSVVNYNRDVESFPILASILERITGQHDIYKSPTDMGVNRAGFAIINDAAAREAAKQEVVRRYLRTNCEFVLGVAELEALEKSRKLMKTLGINEEYRKVVPLARKAAKAAEKKAQKAGMGDDTSLNCGAALELPGGETVTGKSSVLLHAATAAILNGIKLMAKIPDPIHLLSPIVIESIAKFKKEVLRRNSASLDVDEAMIALSISAALNPMVQACIEKLPELRDCQMHMSHMPSPGDEAGLRKLGVNLTSDPVFASKKLFVE